MPGEVFYISSIKYQISAPLIFDESFLYIFNLIGVCLYRNSTEIISIWKIIHFWKKMMENKRILISEIKFTISHSNHCFLCVFRDTDPRLKSVIVQKKRGGINLHKKIIIHGISKILRGQYLCFLSVSLNISNSFNFVFYSAIYLRGGIFKKRMENRLYKYSFILLLLIICQ